MPAPFAEAIGRLDTIPGIDQRAAQNIIVEIGPDMSRFPSAGHLASWVGVCPGNHESAGKQKSGKVRKGNRWLRQALVAVAHRLLVIVYNVLKKGQAYQEPVQAAPDRQQDRERLKQKLIKRLERLGVKVQQAEAVA